jgi:DNA topoisomerase VI subunit B
MDRAPFLFSIPAAGRQKYMGIRIAARAEITKEFRDLLAKVCVKRLKQIQEEMAAKDREQRAYYAKQMAPTIIRLGQIAKDPARGLDMVLTKLRSLPYTDYSVISYPD